MLPNPLAVLEFTPALVRLLQGKPERLMRVAEAHRRWLLAESHPDLQEFGSADRFKLITGALVELKDPERRAAAIEEFLRDEETGHAARIADLRVTKDRLERAAEQNRTLTAEVLRLSDLLKAAEGTLVRSLGQWFSRACLHENMVPLETGEHTEQVSLAGALLIMSALRPAYLKVMIIGENRRVLLEEDWLRSRRQLLAAPVTRKAARLIHRDHVLIGSYVGRRLAPGRSISVAWAPGLGDSPSAAYGVEFSPIIRVGRPLVTCHQRGLEKDAYLWLHGPLIEVRPGTVTVLPGKRTQGLRWEPAAPPPKARQT